MGSSCLGLTKLLEYICWIIEKAREFQKNVYFCFIDYVSLCGGLSDNREITKGTAGPPPSLSRQRPLVAAGWTGPKPRPHEGAPRDSLWLRTQMLLLGWLADRSVCRARARTHTHTHTHSPRRQQGHWGHWSSGMFEHSLCPSCSGVGPCGGAQGWWQRQHWEECVASVQKRWRREGCLSEPWTLPGCVRRVSQVWLR